MSISFATRSIFSLLVVAIFAASAMAQTGEVVLKSSAMVGGPIVCLGDVATINSSDPQLLSELAQIELLPTPRVNRAIYLTINDIRSIIGARGISTSDIHVSGSSRVRMEAATASLNVEGKNETAKNTRQFPGRRVVEEQLPEVMTVAHVVRNVRRGEVLRPEDVEMRELSVVRQESGYPSDIRQVIGKEVTRGIAADRPIGDDDLRQPVVVRRNEVVTVYAYAGNVVVRREMLALNDAGLNELVEVQPIEPTRFGRAREAERFQAKVSAPGEAMVLTGHINVPTAKPLLPLPKPEVRR
ncbi:flagellar basal body P-ring formation protein FlgA [bacterium]|nr:flagellar basal body P-ring formation protein FlgA [bacterium]